MSANRQTNAIYFSEGAGYLLVEVLQLVMEPRIESDAVLVKSLEDNKIYVRKKITLTLLSLSGIPNEIEFNPSFNLIPRTKDVTKHMDPIDGEYYWTMCIEYCEGGDLRNLKRYRSLLADHPKVFEALIWKFIADMSEILGFLRRQKICHSDIYPQNIFLRENNDPENHALPDFLLGDFGWAQHLTDDNHTHDQCLFANLLVGVSGGKPDNSLLDVGLTGLSHSSEDLTWTVDYLHSMSVTAREDILDVLEDIVLPWARMKVDDLLSGDGKLCIASIICNPLAASPFNDDVKPWPNKIEGLWEDWQLVDIVGHLNGSDQMTLRGLAKTSRDDSRNFYSFIRSIPRVITLDQVYLFDAQGQQYPPWRPVPDGDFAGGSWQDFADIMEEIETETLRLNKKDEDAVFAHRQKRRKLNWDSPCPDELSAIESTESLTEEDDLILQELSSVIEGVQQSPEAPQKRRKLNWDSLYPDEASAIEPTESLTEEDDLILQEISRVIEGVQQGSEAPQNFPRDHVVPIETEWDADVIGELPRTNMVPQNPPRDRFVPTEAEWGADVVEELPRTNVARMIVISLISMLVICVRYVVYHWRRFRGS